MQADWKKKLPMRITIGRMLLAPLILAVSFLSAPFSTWGAAIIFIIGSITDWLDGYYARKFNAHTNMGKFMDPIADKVLVLGALVLFVESLQIEPVMVFLLLSRDIFVGGIRAVAAADGVIIDAKSTGKWKTAIQMVAIPCLFIKEISFVPLPLEQIGYWGLWFSVILSLKSGWDYSVHYFKRTIA